MNFPRRSFWNLILIVVFTWMAAEAARAADWPPIGPEELSMTTIKEQPGAPAAVLLREETVDDPNNQHTTYMRIKVFTEEGRRYADVEIPYSRSYFTIDQVSGRTVHADGSIVPFDGQVLDKEVFKSKERDRKEKIHVKSFTLPDVQVGSIVEYRYTLRYGQNVFFDSRWEVQLDLFQKQAAFKYIQYPSDLWNSHGQKLQGAAWSSLLPKGVEPEIHDVMRAAVIKSREQVKVVDLKMNNIPALVREPYMPPYSTLRYQVNFYYLLGTQQAEFWKDEGRFWNKDVEKFLGKTGGVSEAAARAVATNDTAEQKVRKIYAFVSGLENRSYDPQKSQQEQQALGIKNNEGAEDVLRQHSGNHDDLNKLFVAMVRSAGIPAWVMWVPNRERTLFQPTLLSTSQFDAEIAIVELNGKDVFLDPGTKFCQYGLMNWRYSGAQGLRQNGGKDPSIAQSALPDYKAAMIQRMSRVQLKEDGKIEGSVKVGFFGLEAMERRQEEGKTDDAGRKKLLEDEVKRWLPGDSEATLIGSPNWNNTEGPLVAEFKIAGPLAQSSGKRWILPVHILQGNEKARFLNAARVNAVSFDYPSRELDEVHMTLPPGLEIETLPPNDTERLDYAVYLTTQKQEGEHEIVARRDLVIGGMGVPVNQYPEIKGFFDKVKAGDDQQAIAKAALHAEVK
jgi:Domain of Unknown Function with PDB structure (DUF3857)/Transglutaminase-like superfamily